METLLDFFSWLLFVSIIGTSVGVLLLLMLDYKDYAKTLVDFVTRLIFKYEKEE